MTADEANSLGACFKHWRLQKGLPLEVIALKTRIPLKYLRALESNDCSALPPIEPVHHTLGESLREYRERQGLSIESIADRTRIPLTSLQALEENHLKILPEAPVIIRAFVDAYLNCLTLQEAEKEIVLIQFAKMVDTVYIKAKQEPADSSSSVGMQAPRISRRTFRAGSDQLHDRALGLYIRFADWRTTVCKRTISAGHKLLIGTGHFFDRAGSLSTTASLAVSRKIAVSAVELWAQIRPDGGWSTLLRRTIEALTTAIQQIRRAIVSVHRNLAPLLQRALVRHHLVKSGPASDHSSQATPQDGPPEGKPWLWLIQYGITVLLLLLLGSTASTIPLFRDTAFADTKIAASNLVTFIGYGGALLMVWLMGRKAVAQLVRNGSGLDFLRPLSAPFNMLVWVSASYKVLLTLVGPSLGKGDRLAYNWIFVSLIVAATLWLIRTWFLKSAPLLDSLDATDRPNRSGGIAIASVRD